MPRFSAGGGVGCRFASVVVKPLGGCGGFGLGSAPMGGSRLLGLDVLRGIAALIVFAHHIELEYSGEVWKFGFLAVDLFFVLSGYVMARTYEPRMIAGMKAAPFMVIRWRRLWLPLAVGCVIAVANRAGAGADLSVAVLPFILALFFLPGPPIIDERVFPLNEPRWSLFFELAANLLHALLLAKISNRALVATWAIAAFLFATLAALQEGVHPAVSIDYWPLNACRTLMSYVAGILLFRLLKDEGPRHLWPWALAAFPMLIVLGPRFPPVAFQVVFALSICPLLVIALLHFDAGGAVQEAASQIGRISYPLYAVNQPTVVACVRLGLPWPATAMVALILAVAVTWLLERGQGHKIPLSQPAE